MRVKELEMKFGDLKELIPAWVALFGQEETARKLGVSQSWVHYWLKREGYIKQIVYIKQEQ